MVTDWFKMNNIIVKSERFQAIIIDKKDKPIILKK